MGLLTTKQQKQKVCFLMAPKRPGNERLRADIQKVRDLAGQLGERQARYADDNRTLVVLSAGGDADQLYRPALDRLARQASDSGKRLQILLGLNNGAVFPAGWSPHGTDVTHLYAEQKPAPSIPGTIHSTAGLDAPFTLHEPVAEGHELFAVHQPEHPYSAGKIRMLNDLYAMLLRSVAHGGSLPKRLLFMDAESHFHRVTTAPHRPPDQSTNGLEALLAHLEGPDAVKMVGATMRHAAYKIMQPGNERVPDFTVRISHQHAALNATHGYNRHQSLIGGGIAGSTPELLALGSAVGKYPGLCAEDAATSLLASHAGVPWKVARDALVTNFTPPAAERRKVIDQLARWGLGPASIRELYGTSEYGDLTLKHKLLSAAADLWYLLKSGSLLGVLRDKRDTSERVKELPPQHALDGDAAWVTGS